MARNYIAPRLRLIMVHEGPWTEVSPMRTSQDVYRWLKPILEQADREEFWAIPLDTKQRPIGLNQVSIGTLGESLAHPREVFKAAIIANAKAVILAHNHPSGDPAPSAEDRAITKRLKEAGELLGIPVLDHIVIGHGTFTSLHDEGSL